MSDSAPRRLDDSPLTIITGCSGHLGQLVVRRLLKTNPSAQVLGLDLRPPPEDLLQHRRFSFRTVDVRRGFEGVGEFSAASAVIHLAYPLEQRGGYRAIRPFFQQSMRSLLRCIQHHAVPKLLLCSSTTVYGARPSGHAPFREQDEPRPNPTYYYAVGKLEMERLAQEWVRTQSACELVTFRPCIVLGPRTSNYLVQPFFGSEYLVRGADPTLQFLHEEDFAAFCVALLAPGISGTFNLTPDDRGLRRSEILGLFGVEARQCSLAELKARLWVRWLLSHKGAPAVAPVTADLMTYQWDAVGDRVREATGVEPRHGSSDALLDFFKAYRRERKRVRRVA